MAWAKTKQNESSESCELNTKPGSVHQVVDVAPRTWWTFSNHASLIHAVTTKIVTPVVADEDGLATPREARDIVQKVTVPAPDPRACNGIWSTVGSSNFDFRSFIHNDEVNALVLGADFALRLGADFALRMAAQFERNIDVSRPVMRAQWKDRPSTARIMEVFGRSMEYWL